MDRSQARSRARDLRLCGEEFRKLMDMPDRAKANDFRVAAEAMLKAADSIDALLDDNLPGCVCRHIENDNYSYLDYAESCRHHGGLYRQIAELKKSYEKTEKKLKDEARMSLVRAALTGAATATDGRLGPTPRIVGNAISIADEAIHQIVESSKEDAK
jgi:hypothetical protein